jgi:type II secretory pathway component HofQ
LKTFLCFCFLFNFAIQAWAAPVSFSVQNATVRSVLQTLADTNGYSLVMPQGGNTPITLTLTDVPFEKAVRLIAQSEGLAIHTEGTVLYAAVPEQMSRSFGTLSVYPLNYIRAETAHNVLKPLTKSPLTFDALSNTLFVTGSPGEQAQIKKALTAMDRPTKQVTFEACILSLRDEASRELGLTWNWDTLPASSEAKSGYAGLIHLGHGYRTHFQATLSALCQEGKAKVLATPSIITLPGQEGSIFIGDHIPVVTEKITSGSSTYSTEYVDAGIRLACKPLVSHDGIISAEVHTEVSTPTLISELKNYRITSRTADTHVRLKERETLVIGGLISEEEQQRFEAVPLLSKLPLLGELFKFRSHNKNRTEVCIFLTPYLSEPGTSPTLYRMPETLQKKEPSSKDSSYKIRNQPLAGASKNYAAPAP